MHLLVLSAFRLGKRGIVETAIDAVSMHLLVLSAFRLDIPDEVICAVFGLNAPFGAQCFPTHDLHPSVPRLHEGLNAPFGAQCFPTQPPTRKDNYNGLNAPFGAQCFPTWCSSHCPTRREMSQCTFWCSVLSDWSNYVREHLEGRRLNAPFGAQCFPTDRAAIRRRDILPVSMHLLVLSAFRPENGAGGYLPEGVSMHLLVLSAFRRVRAS